MKDGINLIDLMHAAPRCTATAKRTGQPCRAPAMGGYKVCYYHGAGGGAPRGTRNGRYKHGALTQEAITMRKMANQIQRMASEAKEDE